MSITDLKHSVLKLLAGKDGPDTYLTQEFVHSCKPLLPRPEVVAVWWEFFSKEEAKK